MVVRLGRLASRRLLVVVKSSTRDLVKELQVLVVLRVRKLVVVVREGLV